MTDGGTDARRRISLKSAGLRRPPTWGLAASIIAGLSSGEAEEVLGILAEAAESAELVDPEQPTVPQEHPERVLAARSEPSVLAKQAVDFDSFGSPSGGGSMVVYINHSYRYGMPRSQCNKSIVID